MAISKNTRLKNFYLTKIQYKSFKKLMEEEGDGVSAFTRKVIREYLNKPELQKPDVIEALKSKYH